MAHQTKFYGSQVGGSGVTPRSYTGSPLKLLRQDLASAFRFGLFLPFIVYPFTPLGSGPLCELYPSWVNLWSMFLHVILIIMQLPFILSIPFWVFFPLWTVIIGVAVFWAVNQGICYLLNGSKMRYPSNPKYAEKKAEHAHEQWIFLNGVAVGKHWLQSNVDRLALTFGRPVIGVHNKTNGILFDVLQCLIQRNFNYATNDIRDCYRIVKETLYSRHLTKVVFILHSQGGIEGGMIIDWLLQEVPQDLLAKLEVYTFGCAANHFNNPHLHLLSQHAALTHPTVPSTTRTLTSVHYHDPLSTLPAPNNNPNSNSNSNSNPNSNENENGAGNGGISSSHPRSSKQESTSGKTIRYVEHYAHTSDFVARWGVLHFTCNFSLDPTSPRYMGRVFERPGEGHQFNQHYLDAMFPLESCPSPSPPKSLSLNTQSKPKTKGNDVKGGVGGSGFLGAKEKGNAFMESVLSLGHDGDEKADEREGVEMSYLGAHGEPLEIKEKEVLIRDMSPISPRTMGKLMRAQFENGGGFTNSDSGIGGDGDKEEKREEKKMEFRVKDLSRLWLYVNGKSPKVDEVDVGIARIATI